MLLWGDTMPTVICQRIGCEYRGGEVCTADRINLKNGKCQTYRERIGPEYLKAPFNPNCHREGNKFKSNSHKVVR